MKKYFLKLLGFCFIIFILGMIITELFPYNNRLVTKKYTYFESHPYNTVFIGSSKINNQIDCPHIDLQYPNLSSYNLGVNGSFVMENFNTLERILQHPQPSIKTIVLELSDKIDVTQKNYNSERSFSVFNLENYWFDLQFQWEQKSWKQLMYIQISYLLNTLDYNKLINTNTIISPLEINLFKNNQGFFPLNKDPNLEVKKRNRALLKDTMEIQRRINAYYSHKPKKPSQVYCNKLQQLAEKCKEKNITLILFIPAPAEPNAKDLLEYKKILKIPVIENIDPKQNPEFYLLKNRWDYGHLNQRGAYLLSMKIAKNL